MVWERQKSIISTAPDEPSLISWLITGVIALVAGVLLFLLHASQRLGPFQGCNIRVLSATPTLTWLVLICLRAWRYHMVFNRYRLEFNEAEYAQQRWTEWAGRYQAILHSTALLPGSFTAAQFIQPAAGFELHGNQVQRLPWSEAEGLSMLLGDVSDTLLQLPAELSLSITLLTDSPTDPLGLQERVTTSWKATVSVARPIPDLKILQSHSLLTLDTRLKQSATSAELILVQQLQGGDRYSDALAALLLVSDDVATQYALKHDVRLLRPMGLNQSRLAEELALFFSIQTQANRTQFIVGDRLSWAEAFVELLNAREPDSGRWKTEHLYLLEHYSGICGPFSPWITAIVASDMVSLQQTPGLVLATDNEQSFITTLTTGDQNKANR